VGITYREDPDLAFLQFAEEDDLRELAYILTHNEKGKPRLSGSLLSDPVFYNKGKPDQYRKCWQIIAGELQHFGGDTLANKIRGKGVIYREIIRNVCGKLGIKLNRDFEVWQAEMKLIRYITEKLKKTMTDEEKAAFSGRLGSSSSDGNPKYFNFYKAEEDFWTTFRFGSAAASSFFGFIASIAMKRFLAGTLLGSFGLLLGITPPESVVTGPAYRVTTPSAIKIASMRQKYLAKEERF